MARRRFFVPEVRRGVAELSGSDAEHLVRVLRVEPGQLYELSDNRNVYLAEIESARKSAVIFRIRETLPAPVPTVHITLIAALIKFDHFEWLIEKATELGVSVIQPFEAIRTERGLAQASAKRRARWERIVVEASQQSRRAYLPIIDATVRLEKTLSQNEASTRLQLDENPDLPPIVELLPVERSPADRVALLLGPEGGWTEEERGMIAGAGWQPCSLGPNVLRAETAGMAALAIVQAAWHQK